MFKDLHVNTDEQLKRDEARAKAFAKPQSAVKSVRRERLDQDNLPEGEEILKVIFTPEGPAVLLTDTAEAMLRGPDAQSMRTIIEDSIKAVMDKITVH